MAVVVMGMMKFIDENQNIECVATFLELLSGRKSDRIKYF
jgi:hypothetical protein